MSECLVMGEQNVAQKRLYCTCTYKHNSVTKIMIIVDHYHHHVTYYSCMYVSNVPNF